MRVRVKTYGFIAQVLSKEFTLELNEGSTLGDLLGRLSKGMRGFDLTQELILVNGKAAKLDEPLRDGAEVSILPAVIGG